MMRIGGGPLSMVGTWTDEGWGRRREGSPGVCFGTLGEPGALREIERVLRVPRRVLGRGVQGVEAVELRLHLGPVGDGEADLAQDPAELLADERQGMERAGAPEIGRAHV